MHLIGCDFSSSPSRTKPIVQAHGRRQGVAVVLVDLVTHATLDDWQQALSDPGPWVGGFDLPLGLPRTLVQALGWPTDWPACMDHYARLSRADIRAAFARFCDGRPAGQKMAHRTTDGPAGSSPSMKWVNPPVAYMMHAGVPRLRAAGVALPGLAPGDPGRVALEAYPGYWARAVLGRRSYKSDSLPRAHPDQVPRRQARAALVHSLMQGHPCAGSLRLQTDPAQTAHLVDDPRGDALDAVLCLMQAAWADHARAQGHPHWGLPDFDPLEGWIVSVPSRPCAPPDSL